MANRGRDRKGKSQGQQRREVGLFGAVVTAGAAAASKGKGKRGRAVALLLCLAILVCGVMYYFDISPFDFEIGSGFKYYTYTVGDTPRDYFYSDGELVVHFIDVGQGDCIFVQLPDGKTMLIDGGERRTALAEGIPQYLLSLYPDTNKVVIDYLFLTHCDSDHCGSLDDVVAHQSIDVLNVYQPRVTSEFEQDPLVKAVADNPSLYENVPHITTQVYASFVEAVYNEKQEGICEQIYYNYEGMSIKGESWGVYLYNPSEEIYRDLATGSQNADEKNNVSPIMLLSFADFDVLLTGDADEQAELNFADYLDHSFDGFVWDGDCEVLKVGHHGGAESSNEAFLSIVKPEYAVISVGENKYGHPAPSAINRLDDYVGEDLYTTLDKGTVILTVNNAGETDWQFGK